MLLLKNPQFLLNHYKNLSKYGTHEDLTLAKFCNNWVKFVDFLIKAYFWVSPETPGTHCKLVGKSRAEVCKFLDFMDSPSNY